MNFAKRILYIIQEEQITKRKFAEILGVTESYISTLTSGRRHHLSNSLAELIEAKFGYSKSWILEGKEPIRSTKDIDSLKTELIEVLDDFTQEEIDSMIVFLKNIDGLRNLLTKYASYTNDQKMTQVNEDTKPMKYIPILGSVGAGTPLVALNDFEKLETDKLDADFAVIVKGNSMYPLFYDTMTIFCQEQSSLDNGDIGIIQIASESNLNYVVCKKFYLETDCIRLVSINPEYDDIIVDDFTKVHILGKVLD